MIEIIETGAFSRWLEGLRDRQARLRVVVRIRRFALGNAGDVKAIGGGLSELRMPYGSGYRVYFAQHGDRIVILLAGGTKPTQPADIARARRLLEEWTKQ